MGRDYPLALADRAILSRSVARGVERVFFGLAALVIVTWLAGCTGLQQFPATPERYSKALTVLDKDYANALAKIYPDDSTRVEDSKAIQIRNHLIEMRMAVIDAHYRKFVAGLAREDVGVEFGTSLIGIGVGGAGALVSETTSQILSAVSGGLAGAQSAYGKAVLYDRAMTALIAQMDASRAAIATQIFQRWSAGIDSYPLWLARGDLEAYAFAGSLPGAIVATAADAKVKEQEAFKIVSKTVATREAFSQEAVKERASLADRIAALSAADAKALLDQMENLSDDTQLMVAQHYPDSVRNQDSNGAIAKQILNRMIVMTGDTGEDRARWLEAIRAL